MAAKKKKYTVRYDRIFGVLIIVFLLLVILITAVSSCSKNEKNQETVSETQPSETVSVSSTTETNTEKIYPALSIQTEQMHSGHLIVVNAAYPCVFDTDAVEAGTSSDINFVTIKSILDTKTGNGKPYTASDWEVGLDRVAALAMDSWLEDFYQQTGHNDLRMIGGYQPSSDDPDFQTGRTLTIGVFPEAGSSYAYKPEGEYAWLSEHAYEYGFILRYPEDKENYFDETITDRTTATFRYVGLPAAAYITNHNLCLEEFVQEIKSYTIDNMLLVTVHSKTYGMYYIPANTASDTTSFYLPEDNASYEISGNNIDGFIITIYL